MRKIIRGSNPGTPRVLPGNEGVMIKAKPRIQTEISHMPRILYECRLRAAGRFAVKMKILRNVSIENAHGTQTVCRDVKAQIFPNRREPSLESGFQFMLAIMRRNASGNIPFAKAAVLRRLDRCRQVV